MGGGAEESVIGVSARGAQNWPKKASYDLWLIPYCMIQGYFNKNKKEYIWDNIVIKHHLKTKHSEKYCLILTKFGMDITHKFGQF